MKDYETLLVELKRASKKLSTDQGMIARRNARKRVVGLLKNLRIALDEQYPNMRRKPKNRVQTEAGKTMRFRARMRSRAYEMLSWNRSHGVSAVSIIDTCRSAGIKVHRDPVAGLFWTPKWVRALLTCVIDKQGCLFDTVADAIVWYKHRHNEKKLLVTQLEIMDMGL